VTIRETNKPPVFALPAYYTALPENAAVSTGVIKVAALDTDTTAPNNVVTYSISGGNVGQVFSIDSSNGQVRVASALDYETRTTYVLTIVANDGGSPSLAGSTTVVVSVADVNDKDPVFESSAYSGSVSESASIGSVVLTVRAVDADGTSPFNQVSYQIVDGNVGSKFAVGQSNGKIVVNGILDYETVNFYSLTVAAIDSGAPTVLSFTSVVNITVQDVNDNYPVFQNTPYTASLSESVIIGTPVKTVTAIDADGTAAFNTVSYSIVGGNSQNKFSINSATGAITTQATLDFDTTTSYTLTVRATDSGAPSVTTYQTIVSVSLTDVNDNAPTFTQTSYSVSVSESATTSSAVLTIVATDGDKTSANNVVTYTITGGSGSGNFTIGKNTGVLSTKGKLDYEKSDSLTLTVEARDNGTPSLSSSKVVNVAITDVNDNTPQFDAPVYIAYVPITAALNTPVLTMAAADLDGTSANNQVTFTIDDGAYGHFAVSSTDRSSSLQTAYVYVTGDLTEDPVLDDDGPIVYWLTINAQDNGSPSRSNTTLMIIHVEENTAPFFQEGADFSTTISSSSSVGDFVTAAAASDDNQSIPFGVVTYSFGSSTGSVPFAINAATGDITVSGSLTESSYSLEVVATDGGSLSATITFVITVA